MSNAGTSIASLRAGAGPAEASMPVVAPGFGSLQSFELMQRQAKLLCSSSLVPVTYRSVIVKTDYKGNIKSQTDNPNALSNCVIALNMAARMNADPLMVMQNLYLVEGRPSWSSQWIIAMVNNCGRFSPLRFAIKDLGKRVIEYVTFEWENNERIRKVQKVEIHDQECIAWVIEKGTEEKLYGPAVSIGMAVAEGWYSKNGSKWQTMPDVMLRYRASSFFGKLYAPELLMGLPSREEVEDTIEMELQGDGKFGMAAEPAPYTVEELQSSAKESVTPAVQIAHQPAADPIPTQVRQPEPVAVAETASAQSQQGHDSARLWEPSPEEQAEIRNREKREAAAQNNVPDGFDGRSGGAPSGRRHRGPIDLGDE